ncbi:MAG: tyrosine-protein phosphatase [Spirochaetaceae bacterium]|jgi:protein-tyrosine phosphatase|nr:tyrosine-protein phosphatase [Spirochaetaceae bacterium]
MRDHEDFYRGKSDLANFREVCAGGIAPKRLYRSCHPIIYGNRGPGMMELAQQAGIAAVLNLSDNEEILSRKAPLVPWYHKLFQEDRIIALNMDFDVFGDRFFGKLNRGVKFIIDREGPYLIHCVRGIERTGFFVMLLEMLMGAEKTEIVNDYLKSFSGKPGFEKDSWYYKQEHNYFIAVMKKLNGGKSAQTNILPILAEKYLLENAGLTRLEVDLLKARLSTTGKIQNADVLPVEYT